MTSGVADASSESSAIDAFIEQKVQPDHRAIVAAFRQLVARVAPELKEGMRGGTEKYFGVPVYRLKRDVIAISPSKQAITISFARGAAFDDPYGLLGGAGKTSKTVRLKSMGDFDSEALSHYVKQAVAHDRDSEPAR